MRRTSYIWLGRSLMVLSLPMLGLSIGRLSGDQSDFLGWTFATLSSLLYGIGTLISGSPFLALVRDSAPPEKQGLAISTVETVLIIFFAIVGISFSIWMRVYDERIFWQMILGTMLIGGFFWFFAIFGAEKRGQDSTHPVVTHEAPLGRRQIQHVGFAPTFRKIWADSRTRRFFFFLSLSTLSAWAQDAILEPFGAEVFHLEVERTTRFNSYWQTATVRTLVGGAYLWRKRPPETQSRIANAGLITMAIGMIMLALTSMLEITHMVELSLFVFGAGFGVYTFGGLSLMAVMCTNEEAGAYLGLWTISILIFKGLGTFFGGGMRDLLLLNLKLTAATTYGVVFSLEAVGLLGAVLILSRLDVIGFARDVGRTISRTEAQIATAD
jgi:BCD family chlorophyll transporter-like MFS transporter